MKVGRILFLFICACLILLVPVYAQKQVTVINPGFEKPDSGKIKGWDGKCSDPTYTGKVFDIPGWKTDNPDSGDFDSGIEPATNFGGKYRAYMMGKDTSMYQICRRIGDGDILQLSVDASNNWQADKLRMEMFYLQDDSVRVSIVQEDMALTNTITTYSISFNTADNQSAVGWKLGILFDNVSTNPQSWLNFDNVQVTNNDPTIIEVVNYSFELPDSGKIKGWDGPGSSPNIADSQADIPGWSSDSPVIDSGVEHNSDCDGAYEAFMRWDDDSVWNTTDYTILAGDVITLKVAARSSWLADAVLLELYYDDAGTRKTLAQTIDAVTLTGSTGPFEDHVVWFAADAAPECIGKKVGVLIKNPSTISNSWVAPDLVRLNANHAIINGIKNTNVNPNVFALAQNYPNPFNPTTNISYSVKNNGKVRLSVYDVLGREVAVVVNQVQTAGPHTVTFSGNGLSSGMYFYKLEAGNKVLTKKMVLLK